MWRRVGLWVRQFAAIFVSALFTAFYLFDMEFQEFCKKYRCSVSEKRIEIGHRHQRNISLKFYTMHVDIDTLLPFNPKKQADSLRCLSFSSETSEGAKQKAYEAIKESGSLDILSYFQSR